MANSSTVALNIGSQRISLASFSSKGGNITLNGYACSDILADPILDATRGPKIQAVVADLARQLKVEKSSVHYAISGQASITRFVKLPPFDEENVEQLVQFEAQQVIPIPIEEITWSYGMLQSSGLDKEAAIFAIKSDQLNEIHTSVLGAGLSSSTIDAAPAALYNAFRHSYGKLDEAILLVDIGARATNLLYIEGDKFFARTTNIGGATITSAISKAYNISFSESEQQKVSNGLVSLGEENIAQLDEATCALASTIRNALSKLPAEISRTTNLYRSQQGGGAPARIFLAGGGANLSHTKEFFEEKLNLPVEIFNPLQRVTVGQNVDIAQAQANAHLMGELVGVAAKAFTDTPLSIDLVPETVADERADAKRRPVLVAAALLFLLALGAWATLNHKRADQAVVKAEKLEAQATRAALPARLIKQLEKEEKALDVEVTNAVTAELGRSQWLSLIKTITENASSPYCWTTELVPLMGYDPLDPNKPGRAAIGDGFSAASYGQSITQQISNGSEEVNAIKLKGFWRKNADSDGVVYNIVKRLRANGGELFSFKGEEGRQKREVDLTDSQLIKGVAMDDKKTYAWPYEIIIPLKQPIQL